MKKMILWMLALVAFLAMSCTACGKSLSDLISLMPTSTPETESSDTNGLPIVPGQSGQQEGPSNEQPPEENDKRSTTYEPSIFIIEAAGTWQHEIEDGYYANYECELYLDKIEPHNMHDDTGSYTGTFWLKMTLDTGEYLSDILKDVPFVDISLDAEAEGIREGLSFYLRDGYTRDHPESYFDIPDEHGGNFSVEQNTLADKGSFVITTTNANLEAHGEDTQYGTVLDFQDNSAADLDVGYTIHVSPDPERKATQRNVKIHLMLSDGSSTILDGVWHRLPGYPEDLEDYANSGKRQEIIEKH